MRCQAYHEATEAVRMSVFVQSGESKRTDYDSRRTGDRFSDRGSIPLRSIPEKPLKSSVLAVFLYIFDGKNRAKMPL